MRRAFTLVELLVVLGVISILMGLTLPAVQAVRESARSTGCQNNLRQIALASINYESSHRHLPGSWFNAPMDSLQYNQDRGLFVAILPFIEQDSLANLLNAAATTFSTANNELLSTTIGVLQCPSAEEAAKLTGIAELFSGPMVAKLTSVTCDYTGNGGYKPNETVPYSATEGPIGIQISGNSEAAKITMRKVSDGLSNTLIFWESLGGKLVDGRLEFDVDANAPVNTVVTLSANLGFLNEGQAANKSYWLSWAGLRLGNVQDHDGKTINVSNSLGQPFSRHPAGCNMARVDGSVQFVSELIEPAAIFALASAAGQEPNVALD